MEEPMIEPGFTHLCENCLSSLGYSNIADFLEYAGEDYSIEEEGRFSWSPCDNCNCKLGGDRYAAHNRELNHYEICGDCLYLLANGSYPDDFIPCN